MERNVIFVGSFVLLAFFIIALESTSCSDQPSMETLQLALHSPSEESLATVVAFGTDSRYYSVVSGWARYELSGVQSQIGSSAQNSHSDQLIEKEQFLREVIRRIDLE